VSGVVGSFAFAGNAERLARVARKDEVKASSKAFRREGSQVRVQSFDSQLTFFSLCDQVRQGVGFDLHSNDSHRVFQCAGQSEFETSVACTKR
jgi:hypothetical protein